MNGVSPIAPIIQLMFPQRRVPNGTGHLTCPEEANTKDTTGTAGIPETGFDISILAGSIQEAIRAGLLLPPQRLPGRYQTVSGQDS